MELAEITGMATRRLRLIEALGTVGEWGTSLSGPRASVSYSEVLINGIDATFTPDVASILISGMRMALYKEIGAIDERLIGYGIRVPDIDV